ncbi:MAG: hypothetical protein R2795_01815 [Saprospiraceae bacterium]
MVRILVGCNTGQVFTWFAFDSAAGLGCGGSPNDGDPGNNFGDGANGCSSVPDGFAEPFVFCFDISVSDCPPYITGDDIGISVRVYSDGDSGSWTLTGCNSGQVLDITSSIICCNDEDPIVTPYDASCIGASDGYIEVEGNAGIDANEVFNFYVFDDDNNIVYECINCSGLVTTPHVLPAGSYTITALNVSNDCARSFGPFDISDDTQPEAFAMMDEMVCPGDLTTLLGEVDSPGNIIEYDWTSLMEIPTLAKKYKY